MSPTLNLDIEAGIPDILNTKYGILAIVVLSSFGFVLVCMTQKDRKRNTCSCFGDEDVCFRKRKSAKESAKENNVVKVLCANIDADYQRCFERIIGEEYKINWMRKTPENISKEKYVVLFKVKSRMPEDVEEVLNDLDLEIEGQDLVNNILFVAMHGEKESVDVHKRIGSVDHRLQSFQTINISPSGNYISDRHCTKEIKEGILAFISC